VTNREETYESESVKEHRRKWAELKAKYLHALPEEIARMEVALRNREYAPAKKHAHRIKGTSATFGFRAISRSAARLERIAAAHAEDEFSVAVNEIMRLVEHEISLLDLQDRSQIDGAERGSGG